MTIAIFLSHTSGLIDNNEEIKSLIEFISGDIPPFALSGLGIIRYLLPYVLLITDYPDLVSSFLDPMVIVMFFVLIFILYQYYKLRSKVQKIAEYANYMCVLGKESVDEHGSGEK